jgi:tRNA(Arg) A34 adenosine deaminase TadA
VAFTYRQDAHNQSYINPVVTHLIVPIGAIFYIMETDPGFIAALEEARAGAAEGGVPIGAALVAADGRILGRGHNMRVQKDSPILHVCCNQKTDAKYLKLIIYTRAKRQPLRTLVGYVLKTTKALPCTLLSPHAICVLEL